MQVHIVFSGDVPSHDEAVKELQEIYNKVLERVYDKLVQGSD